MNLCSGGATVSLVAELTGLTEYRYTKWVQITRLKCQVWNVTLKERHKKKKQREIKCYSHLAMTNLILWCSQFKMFG